MTFMDFSDVHQRFAQTEGTRLHAVREEFDTWGRQLEATMQANTPPPDDARESPTDFTVETDHPADERDGGRLVAVYTDPLGVLSERDLDPSGEDSAVITQAIQAETPRLLDALGRGWHG